MNVLGDILFKKKLTGDTDKQRTLKILFYVN